MKEEKQSTNPLMAQPDYGEGNTILDRMQAYEDKVNRIALRISRDIEREGRRGNV
jgi:hypothetical protein